MNVALVGDVVPGICLCVVPPMSPYPATGVVMNGYPLFANRGMPVALAGSMVMFPCGSSVILPMSPMLNFAGTPAGLTGASVVGCGQGTLVGTSTIMSV